MEGKIIFYIIFAAVLVVQITMFFAKSKFKEWLFTLLYCVGAVILALIAFFMGDNILRIIASIIVIAAAFFIIKNVVDKCTHKENA